MLLAACIGVGIWLALNIAFIVVRLRKPDDSRVLTTIQEWDG